MRPWLPTASMLLLWVLASTVPAVVAPWMSLEVLVGIDGMGVANGRFGEQWEAVGGEGGAGPIAVQLPHKTPHKNFVCPQTW